MVVTLVVDGHTTVIISQKASQLAVVVTVQNSLNQQVQRLAEGFTAGCGCDLLAFRRAQRSNSQKASQLAVVVTLKLIQDKSLHYSQKASQLAVVVTNHHCTSVVLHPRRRLHSWLWL